jgi:hypothetical protein
VVAGLIGGSIVFSLVFPPRAVPPSSGKSPEPAPSDPPVNNS